MTQVERSELHIKEIYICISNLFCLKLSDFRAQLWMKGNFSTLPSRSVCTSLGRSKKDFSEEPFNKRICFKVLHEGEVPWKSLAEQDLLARLPDAAVKLYKSGTRNPYPGYTVSWVNTRKSYVISVCMLWLLDAFLLFTTVSKIFSYYRHCDV